MLDNIIQIPKINNYLLSPVVTTLGLKQGDNLSPILFYLFSDDVDEILNPECDSSFYSMTCPSTIYSMQMTWLYFLSLVRVFRIH